MKKLAERQPSEISLKDNLMNELESIAINGPRERRGDSFCRGGSARRPWRLLRRRARELATKVQATGRGVTVGVTKVVKKSLGRQLTLSSELVPFQEIDVYAKESGYVKQLTVDYGTHVKAGQVMAVLEIPELEAQLQEDQAEIRMPPTRSVARSMNCRAIRRNTMHCTCNTRG